MKKWLIIGIIIRLVIIPITYHPDLNLFWLGNYLLVAKQMWLGFYDFLGSSDDPLAMVQPPNAFTYPPLAILSGGLWASLLYRLIDLDFVREVILGPGKHAGNLGFSWLVFLTKLQYLLPDIGVGWLLHRIVKAKLSSESIALKTFVAWMINPITLYATFAIGQFDIYPVFFMVLAVWLIDKSKIKYQKLKIEVPAKYLSGLALGIGGAFKLFPLLFLPFLILGYGKTVKEKLGTGALGILGYLLPILPYLPSAGFRQFALLAPQTDKMLFANIPVSGAEYLSVFVVGYVVLVWLFVKGGDSSAGRRLSQNDRTLWKAMAAVLLLFFAVTHFHPQWFIWVSPWLVLMIAYSSPFEGETRRGHIMKFKIVLPISVLLLCYLILVLSFESSLNYGILIGNQGAPDLMSLLPTFLQLEKFKYLSLVRSMFAGTAGYLILWLLNQNYEKRLN